MNLLKRTFKCLNENPKICEQIPSAENCPEVHFCTLGTQDVGRT